ncbi:ABC transporter permease [Aeromicrobium sp. CF4.19]|uniref:ABC transporter permease n=1 Tax=Aeromicrobium sp. CF4.19 TaxID=3373082 RepID=UPI003EE43F91
MSAVSSRPAQPRQPRPQPRRPRPLPLRAEIGRQLGRRRTRLSFGFVLLLPLLLVGAFALGSDGNDEGGGTSFVDLAQVGPANLAVFALFASTGFLLVVLVALFAGDAVPAEASWATLRYLLAAPVPRGRLLRVKLAVASLTSLAALVLLPLWCLVVGWVAYGTDSYRGPSGEQLSWGELAPRLALVVAYLFVSLFFVAALAFLVGVLTDAPLGAVGSAVLLTIVSNILDAIPALGDLRQALPTHGQFAWADALQRDIDWSGMTSGALWSIAYSVVLLTVSFVLFARKDVLS